MGATPTYLLPYPELTDPADVPLDVKELADRLEAVFGPGSADGQIPVWNQTTKKWTAAQPAGAELGYAEKTSSSTLTGLTTEAASMVVAQLAPITFDGTTKAVLELSSPAAQTSGTAGAGVIAQFWDNGVSMGHACYVSMSGAFAISAPFYGRRRLTPTAGAHTFAFRAYQQGASACILQGGPGGAGGYSPAWLRCTRG